MSISDTVKHVSIYDPARIVTKVPVDPNDPSGPTKEEVTYGDDATIFRLSSLDVYLMADIYDNTSAWSQNQATAGEATLRTKLNKTNLEACRFGLRGWSNFKDAKGNDITLEKVNITYNGRDYEVVSDTSLQMLGIRLVNELGAKIKELSNVSRAEEKNSEGASLH